MDNGKRNMETLKNFIVGFFVAILALIFLTLCFISWPFILGIGSILFFLLTVVLSIVLVFYIVVLIGYVVRKGLKEKG